MFLGTEEEIERILEQLEAWQLPFAKYSLVRNDRGLMLLGRGASARVYEIRRRGRRERAYALKVIGFEQKRVDPEFFAQAVRGQMETGAVQEHVVQLYGHAELLVQLDEDNRVLRAERTVGDGDGERCLHLQFVLMEKLEVVLTHTGSGKLRLIPDALARFEEAEILKLACDVAGALAAAHRKHILHRDVKPENIFYSRKKKCYKLGDFGIARYTEEGLAKTVVFTGGYGAPEVVSAGGAYDNTADIYSLGILLYVLLNQMRFPGSEDYRVRRKEQYREGYVVPRPVHGSDALCAVVERMCSYNPDERFQSMDEVLRALERIRFGSVVSFQKKHRRAPLALAAMFFPAGIALWHGSESYRWASVTLSALAVLLLVSSMILYLNHDTMTCLYFKQQCFWLIVIVFFFSIALFGYTLDTVGGRALFGMELTEFLAGLKLQRAGVAGAVFGLIWVARNRILDWMERRRQSKS